MKITLLFMLLQSGLFGMQTGHQEHKVSLQVKDVTLEKAITELRKQTGLRFFYSMDKLKETGKITVDVQDQKLSYVLDLILSKTDLTYSILDDVIMIKDRENTAAQQQSMITVTGKVTDEEGTPLPGVTVLIKGTQLGAATDLDGNYTLSVPAGDHILLFTMIGMETREEKISQRTVIHVILKNAVNELKDVIVTGYFNKAKDSFTGAVTRLDEQEIRKFGSNSVLEVIQHMVPGLRQAENNEFGSDPNRLPDFILRGKGSFLGETSMPIFIVDGYQVDLERVYDMDIQRIASVTVLKDASATIYYGSRASNGVIVIETKTPEAGDLQVTYSFKPTVSIADFSDYNLMNAREKLEYELRAKMYEHKDPGTRYELEKEYARKYGEIQRGVDIDWLSIPTTNSFSHKHSLYVEGGDKVVKYALDASYDKNNGIMKESSRDRGNIGFYLTYRISDKVSIRNYLSYAQTKADESPYGNFSQYTFLNPYDSPVYANGEYKAKLSYNQDNPLYNARLAFKDQKKTQYITDNLTLDLYILNNLRIKGFFAIEKSVQTDEKYLSPKRSEYLDKVLEEKGLYSVSDANGINWDANVTVNYNETFGKHLIFLGLGANWKENKLSREWYEATGFPDDRLVNINFAMQFAKESKPKSSVDHSRLMGVFGNFNYSFDNRYFLDLSYRLDGSSKFGKNSRYAPFYSAGIGWNLHKESFLAKYSWLSLLKLRGSIGYTGNQEFDPWLASTSYIYAANDYYYNWLGVWLGEFGNKYLKWQKTLTTNIGLDFALFDNRLAAELNYYIKKTDGLLLPVSVPPSLGFTQYTENYGKIENRGFELDLRAHLIRSTDIGWTVALKASRNRNKVIEISNALKGYNDQLHQDGDNTKPIPYYQEGESVTAIKAVQSLGINPENGKEVFLKKDGTKTYEWDYRDKIVLGDEEPDWFGNISTNFSYQNWTLNLLFSYQFGGQAYNETLARKVEGAYPSRNADKRVLEERWNKAGDHVFYKDIADKTVTELTSRFVQDLNYLQLSNLSVQYDFDKSWIKKLKMEQLRLGLYMTDVFRISSVKQERGTAYPFARAFSCLLQVTF